MREACNNVMQCIVDECGMCMEPETLIPIVYSKAQQVVLIGDHMQLQPIVKNRLARSLGLRISMFERFSDNAFMLEEQYRMHPDICEFPSQHFYGGKLVTPLSVIDRDRETRLRRRFINFWPSHSDADYVPLVRMIKTVEDLPLKGTPLAHDICLGNVEVVNKLSNCGVMMDRMVVLSPYRAQCHIIRKELANDVPVISIVRSQGSEFDFVIISLVRSLPDSQINHEPDGGWLGENLGFVTDEHQINVALTRAKRGLVIIGNKNLLKVCEMWSYLIDHYKKKACFVEGADWPWI
ncbi:helicase with zinc finger domain 2-like [Orbicella faveolata]|uniref:helicase with zinc finger domain 2-like n=1 Tax=Orbicella faveolata TaxID=48498 RepID=UPI0009E58268|nr:helicase with zinc finger domain 2-like [Orbicella faveolata]